MTSTHEGSVRSLSALRSQPSPAGERAPLPPSLGVRAARDRYLAENGFDTASYTAPTFEVEAFGKRYQYRNTPDRMWAIPLHDLHHAATGYGTDLVGEAEVGAFELVGGCRRPVTYFLNGVAVLLGLFVAPLRTTRALYDARGACALYRQSHDYDALMAMSLGELRARLRIPAAGLAREPRRLHDEREKERSDAMPGAPRLPFWAAAAGALHGLSTAGVVALELARGRTLEGISTAEGGARWLGLATAAFGALLAAGAPAARRGSLGGRALFGHAAFALLILTLVALLGFDLAPPLAALAIAVPLLSLAVLARR